MRKVYGMIFLIVLPLGWAQKPRTTTRVIRRTRTVVSPQTSSSSTTVVLFTNQSATSNATSPLTPNSLQSGFGTLTVSGSGVSGSPVCTMSLYYANMSSGTVASSPFATVANFTLSNTFQNFPITPIGGSGTAADGLVATYTCSTFPLTGTMSASFNTSLPSTILLPSTGGLTSLIACNQRQIISTATAGNTLLVAASASYSIYICGWTINTPSTTAVAVKLVTGAAGTTCTTSQTDVTETVTLQALTGSAPVGAVVPAPSNAIDKLPLNQGLCVNLSTAQQVNGKVWYAQF